ncbi:MAG: hypothetical protein R3208_19125, partial [Ketobacteraceae bacterium]|nr:hypothetical protein [Ketobacteraceae bacterium]
EKGSDYKIRCETCNLIIYSNDKNFLVKIGNVMKLFFPPVLPLPMKLNPCRRVPGSTTACWPMSASTT